jgi:hypothetical protein
LDKKIINLKSKEVIIMTTIEKNIKIPDNKRVNFEFDVPENVPIGEAKLQVTIISTQEKRPTWKDLQQLKENSKINKMNLASNFLCIK